MRITRKPGAPGFAFCLFPKPDRVEKPNVYGLFVEGDTVWYGCDKQLCQLRGGEVTVFGAKAGVPESQWKGIRRAGNGDLWAQGRSELALLRSGSTRFEMQESAFRKTGTAGVLSVDSGGRIIVGTNDGLAIRAGSSWKNVGRSSGLRGSVYCAIEDREGSLWIGLLGRGLMRWVGYREWESFTSESGLQNETVYQMLPLPDGTVWAGTEGGLFRGHKVNGVWAWRSQPQFGGISIHCIRPDRAGRLWLGTESKGAARFNPITGEIEWFSEKQGLNAKSPYTLALDGRNRIWAATDRGLFVADLSSLHFRKVEEVPSIQTFAVIETANGDIWVGSDKGLFHLSGGKWSHLTESDGLNGEVILSLAGGKNGDVWIGYRYGRGLDCIQVRGGVPKIGNPSNNPNGKPATVYFLGFDTRERLWAGTDRGLDVWDGSAWNHYDRRDGLVWDDCDLNGFAAALDGSVWIGTSGGLARFTPQQVAPRSYDPDVIYTKLILGNRETDATAFPSVSHASNMLHANFSELSFSRESSVLFRYRLTPLFDGWRETQQRELQFDGLPSGVYRLEVLARNGWGRWSAKPAAFSFQIQPPWWQSLWFVMPCLMMTFFLARVLWRLRVRVLVAQKEYLEQQVADRTDELRRSHLQLQEIAFSDALTSLPNRRMFTERFHERLARARRHGEPFALLLVDLDHFKQINDRFGHDAGDAVLIETAVRLRAAVRESECVARLGGDEFAILLTTKEGTANIEAICTRLIDGLAVGMPFKGANLKAVCSVGIAMFPEDGDTSESLYKSADMALYEAKRAGRNNWRRAPGPEVAVSLQSGPHCAPVNQRLASQ
jgi:diguanylate cyclase (GGDEF)-like protein